MIILRTSCCAGWRLDDCDRENCPLLQEPQSIHFSGTIIMIMQYYSKSKLKVLTSLAQGNVVLSEIVGVVKDESLLLVLRMPELMFGLNFKILLTSAGDKD